MPKSHVAFRHWLKWLYSVRREKVSENFLSPKSFSIRGQISLSLSNFPLSLSLLLYSLSLTLSSRRYSGELLYPKPRRRAVTESGEEEHCPVFRHRAAERSTVRRSCVSEAISLTLVTSTPNAGIYPSISLYFSIYLSIYLSM